MPAFPFREAPATPQHQSRRARDDDEGEGEFISPPSAQYAQRDAAEPTELRFPPLAFDAGVAALRQRFKLVMDEDELMPDIKDFKPETILTGLKKRLRDHGLAKDRDSSFGPASAPPPCIQRPAFDKVWFLAEPMDAGQELRSLKFYSVPSSALAQLADLKRNGGKRTAQFEVRLSWRPSKSLVAALSRLRVGVVSR